MDYIIKKSQETTPEETTPDLTEIARLLELGELVKAALDLVNKGIDKGIRADMGTGPLERGTIGGLLRLVPELMGSALTGHLPGRYLESKVKTEGYMEITTDANKKSKTTFQNDIIRKARDIYFSNFQQFTSLLKSDSDLFENLPVNNTTSVDILGAQYKGSDESTRISSDESPYRMILFQLIPTLRQKFEAIESFKSEIGPGSEIDYEGVAERFSEGRQSAVDVEQLKGLYSAIEEWKSAIESFNVSGLDKGFSVPKAETEEEEADTEESTGGTSSVPFARIMNGIQISRINPDGRLVISDPDGGGGFVIDQRYLTDSSIPVINLVLQGDMVGEINSIDDPGEILRSFIINNKIIFSSDLNRLRIGEYVSAVTVETISGGGGAPLAELSIRLNPQAIRSVSPSGSESAEIMQVDTLSGRITVKADDKSLIEDLIKLSTATSTTPLYETVSPSGERVSFTPADIVIGGGKIKDSKGKSFKVTKRKGKSLADRVMSPGFGRVKKKS